MKFKKIDKDELVDNVVVGGVLAGLVLSIPFEMLANGVKKIYNRIPAVARKRERLNAEIRKLEQILGIEGRDETCVQYDPYFYRNFSRDRLHYYYALKNKVERGYKSPDIVLAMKIKKPEINFLNMLESPICRANSGPSKYLVYLMADKGIYNIPDEVVQKVLKEDLGMELFDDDFKSLGLATLSECGRPGDYFIMSAPGEYLYEDVSYKNETIKKLIEDFRQRIQKL